MEGKFSKTQLLSSLVFKISTFSFKGKKLKISNQSELFPS